jgi:hypothetical protein
MALESIKEYNGKQSVELVERDGKYVLEFDDIPALIFVSYDGNGLFDSLLIDGKNELNRRKVTIKSDVESVTTYEMERYAFTLEERKE